MSTDSTFGSDVAVEQRLQPLRWHSLPVVALLYVVNGIVLSLTVGTLPVVLRHKAPLTELGLLTCAALPYTARFFLGRRLQRLQRPKASLLVTCFLLASALVYLAPQAQDAATQGAVGQLFLTFLVLVALVALLETSAQQFFWGSSLRTAAALGLNLGAVAAFVGFIAVQNPSAFPTALWKGRRTPLVTLADVLYGAGSVLFLLVGWIWLLPSPQPPLEGSCAEAAGSAERAFPRLLFLQRLPFLAVECLLPLKLLEKGLHLVALAAIKLLDFAWGIPSGVFVLHILPRAQHKRAWLLAYYSRIAIGIALTSYLPTALREPTTTVWVVLMGVSTFAGNVLFTLQSLWIEERTVGMPQERNWLLGVSHLGSWLPRALIYFASDWMSHRVCFRQEQSFGDVPCPMTLPFTPSPTNLCTDSGGTCVVVHDGFYTVSYTLLTLGLLFAGVFKHVLAVLLPFENKAV